MMRIMFLILMAFGFSGEPKLVTDVPFVQMYRFDDRMVIVIPNGVDFNLTFPQAVQVDMIGTTDATRFKVLPGGKVFHKDTCYIVKDRPDAMWITPERALLMPPCSFCKPTMF